MGKRPDFGGRVNSTSHGQVPRPVEEVGAGPFYVPRGRLLSYRCYYGSQCATEMRSATERAEKNRMLLPLAHRTAGGWQKGLYPLQCVHFSDEVTELREGK